MRSKIILINAGIVFVITAASFCVSRHFSQQSLRETVREDLTEVSDIASALVAGKLELLKTEARHIARSLPPPSASRQETEESLRRHREESAGVVSLSVFDHRRGEVFSAGDEDEGEDVRDVCARQAMDGETAVSAARKVGDKLIVCVRAPMPEGRVLIMAVSGFIFSDVISKFDIWDSGDIFIMDEHGVIIAHRDKKLVMERKGFFELAREEGGNAEFTPVDRKRLVENRRSGFFYFDDRGKNVGKLRVGAFSPIEGSSPPWTLGVQAPLEESPAADVVRTGLLVAAALLLVLGLLAVVFSADFLVKPYRRIKEQNGELQKPTEAAVLATEQERLLWGRRGDGDGRRDERREQAPLPPVLDAAASPDELPDVEGLALHRILQNFDGDRKTLQGVLESYAKNTPPLLKSLRANLDGGRLSEYAVVVHGIKGSSFGIGADAVGEMAAKLEGAARSGDFAFVAERTEGLIRKIEAVIAGLEKMSEDERKLRPRKAAPDVALLRRLRACCAVFDMDGVEEAMRELEICAYDSGGDLVVWLRECVNKTDFQQMLIRLEPFSERNV